MRMIVLAVFAAFCFVSPAAWAERLPRAVIADPAPDAQHPAGMEPLHIPSGGPNDRVEINGVIYTASGKGPHPTFVLFHGLPGNEKNLDLAQAVRRAGWNVVTINYRGSWGSPGAFRFAHTLEDARATLAFVRDPANAAKYRIDPARIAVGGHSMGGWVTAHTLAGDGALLGGVMISAGDIGRATGLARTDRATALGFMNASRETLNTSGEAMVDELIATRADWTLPSLAPALKTRRALVLYSDDFVKADSENFITALRAGGATQLQVRHAATDHSWSDKRLTLQAMVINWLATL
ncbi:MAG: alpha/beta hydrolase [Alphaproteobacteria bacterium]|nr:alpha/beta hydrolase [Alphaproteobacteria bacterium]